LLRWYDLNQRSLPWRGENDPYRIWVSEIMLQQTRVAVVLERYPRFVARFPSVAALAAARASDVLVEWSGLGYYRRARAMHAAARLIIRRHGGKVPRSAESLRGLPGIGRYTSAAIASIAYGEPVAAVDGNVERVLMRLHGTSIQARGDCWKRAEDLLDRKRPGDFNQALMELGATVCLPGKPHCSECPLKHFCCGQQKFVGAKRQRAASIASRNKVQAGYRVLLLGNCVYLEQRPARAALMPSMWELPSANGKPAASVLTIRLRHAITRTDFEILAHLEPQRVKIQKNTRGRAGKWVKLRSLNRLPLTGLTRKILRGFSLLD
jgi:A/G-specific adenine glycosylase